MLKLIDKRGSDVVNLNLELLKKIHADAGNKSHIAITRDWSDEDVWASYKDKTFYDQLYQYDEFLTSAERIIEDSCEDSYFSINSFRRNKKQTCRCWHLNAFVLDFDYYTIKKYEKLSAKEMYERHIKEKLPCQPTAIVDSGRGLYVLYCFKHAPKGLIKTYTAIYKSFYQKFKHLGMDEKAMNVTQIIRLPGTLNTKCWRYVEVLELNDTSYCLKDFFHLMPYSHEKVIKFKKDKMKFTNKRAKAQFKDQFQFDNVMKIIHDFEKLIELRNQKGIKDGYREMLIYLARKRLRHANCSLDQEIEITKKLNEKFYLPLSEKEFLNSSPCGQTRCEKISTIISKLNINAMEQRCLHVLCKKSIKDARRAKKARKHPLMNLTSKQQEMLERRTRVFALKEEGYTNSQIAMLLNIEKSMVTRDLQYINAHKWKFKKNLREAITSLKASVGTYLFEKKTLYKKQLKLLEWLKMSQVLLE